MSLSAAVTVRTVSFDAIRAATNGSLEWFEVDRAGRKRDLPKKQGVYMYVDAHTNGVLYTGKASGQDGLYQRLGGELSWWWLNSKAQVNRTTEAFDDQVPVMRYLYRELPAVWYATVNHRTWRNDPDADLWHREFDARWPRGTVRARDIEPGEPRTADDWEAALQALSACLGDVRSVLGGGSWEAKAGQRGMAAVSWAHRQRRRLVGEEMQTA